MIELAVKVNNVYQKYIQRFDIDPAFDKISLDRNDPKLIECVETTVKNFKGDVDDVQVTVKMQWQ